MPYPEWLTGPSFGADFPVPPPYSVATSLPTYDEAEKAKADAMAAHPLDVLMQRVRRTRTQSQTHPYARTRTLLLSLSLSLFLLLFLRPRLHKIKT